MRNHNCSLNHNQLTRHGHNCFGLQNGFTLLELMLVILLIGLTSAMVVLALPNNSQKGVIDNSKRLEKYLTELSYRARMKGQIFGLYFTASDWQFLEYKSGYDQGEGRSDLQSDAQSSNPNDFDSEQALNEEGWGISAKPSNWSKLAIDRGKMAIEYALPEGFYFQLTLGESNDVTTSLTVLDEQRTEQSLENSNMQQMNLKPQIWILPSGEITPFSLDFLDTNQRVITSLTVDGASNVTINQVE